MRKPRFAWPIGLAAVLSLALVAAACGGGGSGNNTRTTTGSGGNKTLRMAIGSEPPSLDPGLATDTTSAFVVLNTNVPIVYLGPSPDLAPKPALAQSWDVKGNNITLHLRNDVKWTNGDPVTARRCRLLVAPHDLAGARRRLRVPVLWDRRSRGVQHL